MRQRKTLALVLLLGLSLLCACGKREEKNGQLQLYFASNSVSGGATLVAEESTLLPETATVTEVMNALLAGPGGDGLVSLIPSGVEMQSYTRTDEGIVVDFSEQYGGLSDIDLTLADYSIVLTLCQLPEVDAVAITVDGKPVFEKGERMMRPEDLLQDGTPQNTPTDSAEE